MAKLTEIRGELQDLIIRDLLGPWEGEGEKTKASPKSRYLVGMLAPIVTNPEPQKIATDEDEVFGEVATLDDKSLDSDNAEDADEDASATGLLMHPSSMGLRCQVPSDTQVLKVVARWGKYDLDGATSDDGTASKLFARDQFEIMQEIDLQKSKSDYMIASQAARIHVEVHEQAGRRVVEIALINELRHEKKAPVSSWMFQAGFTVTSVENQAVFLPVSDALEDASISNDNELQHLSLLYRDQLEFAIGRACSAMADKSPTARRAIAVRTEWLPTTDIAQTRAGNSEGILLDMKLLSESSPGELQKGLSPILVEYEAWIKSQEKLATDLPSHLMTVAKDALDRASWTLQRLKKGLDLLAEDSNAGEQAHKSFAFMNRAMYEQRIRSEVVLARTNDSTLTAKEALRIVQDRGSSVASWRPFQIAFIIKQIPSMINPADDLRSGDAAPAELLFFPTGGGKTEAYLGLAAFTFAIRRLQGIVETSEEKLDGGSGVGVLMRYTLRLLTSQQFVRATTLVCAAELIRREKPDIWGMEPFRIGLWVGSSVTPKKFEDARSEINEARDDESSGHGLTVLQVKRCPWCGENISSKKDVTANDDLRRIYVHCGDRLGACEFSKAGIVGDEGLPLLTVDEEIYRFPPAFLLATVDKLARLAREGQAASLFGYVREKCERHGYRHPDSNVAVCSGAGSHQAKGKLPATSAIPVMRLRPPDLIIQDELHLITGSLGTAVGLFESVVDVVCSWTTANGNTVKPMVIASTATSRNAENQIRRLYGRSYEMFPPQVLSVSDTYFSTEVPVTEENPGRRYIGVCAPGIRLIIAQIQIFTILQLAGQKLLDNYGKDADAYMTLVAYFNATRELAGMRRHVDDSVTTAVSDGRTITGLPRRTTSTLNVGELTSRISSSEIANTLDRLGFPFDPNLDTTAARAEWFEKAKAAKAAGKKLPPSTRGMRPYDVVLATSMLQVGVDVSRLGLMLVVGQPKNTAEYIQASSRVGRSPDQNGPGLVLTLANWARPRDMAHFEQFDYYHRTFYSSIEALSVTPYSDAALERGLTAVLVSAARILDAAVQIPSLSPNDGAAFAQARRKANLDIVVREITARAANASQSDETAERIRAKLTSRVDLWVQQAETGLMYQKRKSHTVVTKGLLISPEEMKDTPTNRIWRVANSMREVQAEINVVTKPSHMMGASIFGDKKWRFQSANKSEKDGEND